MRIALIGNPNSGKTALFNELTGASQHVGNWPGVTVEQKRGQIRPQYGSGELIDLPGIYSLSPYSMEEIVSRDFLLNSQPDVVINIIDATNLERNFYLSIQLIELNVPMVMALNMIDEVTAEGYRIDTEQLSIDLGIPVVAISATQRIGIDDLMTALAKAHQPSRHELPDTRLEQLINEVEALFSESLEQSDKPDDAEIFDYPLHWAVIKLLEGDELILQQMQINEQTQSEVNRLVADFESTNGLLSTAIANARYQLIHDLIYQVVTVWDDDSQSGHHHHVLHAPEGYLHEPHHTTDMFSNAHYGEKPEPRPPEAATAYISRSDAIDRVLTNRFLALPVFLLVMFFVFHLTFSSTLFGLPSVPSPGVFLQSIVKYGINMFQVALGPLLQEYPWLQSLVIEGLIGGVGTVLTFIPQILLLFFFLTILEDCGYMARAAFIMDRFLRYFGLSGKSFLPMMMGFGCSVPAIMAARTMENQNDRRLTLMLVPFMSCGARTPIYLVMAGAFFPQTADLVVFSLYLVGIVVAVLSGIVLRKVVFKSEPSPFMIELPRYRMPHMHSLMLSLGEKFKDFITRAGTVIALMCLVVWFLSNFGFLNGRFQMTEAEGSLLVAFGKIIAPLFAPLGFGFWIAAVSILSGFVAKESVISTMGALLGAGSVHALASDSLSAANLTAIGFNAPSALSFMVFCLLYLPCVAALVTLKREFASWRWALSQAAYSIAVAYFCSFVVYQVGMLLVS